jgi:excisionase family DNA binding protein
MFIKTIKNPPLSTNNIDIHKLVCKTEVSSLKIEWLDSNEAAQFLKVSVPMLRNMTSNGQIPYYKLGRRNRYRVDELRALLTKEKRGPK